MNKIVFASSSNDIAKPYFGTHRNLITFLSMSYMEIVLRHLHAVVLKMMASYK